MSYLDVRRNPEKFAQVSITKIPTPLSGEKSFIEMRDPTYCKKLYEACVKDLGISSKHCLEERKKCNQDRARISKEKTQVELLTEKCKLF